MGLKKANLIIENGLLSYANPNYHMNPQRMEENSQIYDEIMTTLSNQGSIVSNGREMPTHDFKNTARKNYANLNLNSMGVNLKENNFSSSKKNEFDTSPNESKTKSDQKPEKANKGNKIKYVPGHLNSKELYATIPGKGDGNDETEKGGCEENEDKDQNKDLPPGWEKHEDDSGPYYWHIKTGVTQREPPTWQKDPPKELKTPVASTNPQQFFTTPKNPVNSFPPVLDMYETVNSVCSKSSMPDTMYRAMPRSNTSIAINRMDNSYKRRSFPLKIDPESIRFAVRSLGWMEVSEEDLTPDRSSKAVNKCIIELSSGRNDLLDVVGRWGDGKDLFMDLDDGALKLIDPDNTNVLNSQPIHTIRVWGVGRDNGRDFAYVARDRLTRIHMCHVFRCETPARTIANTLRDICKRIMIERSLQVDNGSSNSTMGRSAIRPTDLPTNQRWMRPPQSFPTPMEEPKKVLKAQYIGYCQVIQPNGMDTVNLAIDLVVETNSSASDGESVSVSVAPSMISVFSSANELMVECRVRYLSFLGIGKNVKYCAFIMHTAQDKYVAHVFYCEPSSGALCKTIEAACKLRYQKCLDAHPEGSSGRSSADSHTSGKGIGATLKNLMNSLTLKKEKAGSS